MSDVLVKCLYHDCKNLVYSRFIFCRECFEIAGSAARSRWRIAFPYPEGYASTVFDVDRRHAITEMLDAVKFGKSQLSLFDKLHS